MKTPEHVLPSDYWNPHHLDDECPWQRLEQKSKNAISKVRRELDIANKFATMTLTEFGYSYPKTVIKRLLLGQQFNGFNWPVGTVVRFEKEMLVKNRLYLGWSQPEYFSIKYLAVLCHTDLPGDQARVLNYTSESFVKEKRRFWTYNYPALFTIGEVDHRRKLKMYWNDYDREDLERVKWLEVLQL